MTVPSAKDAFENELIPYTLLRTNGLPAIKTYLKDGEFHGPYVARDDKGQPEATGIYYEGKRVGIWSLLQEGGYVLEVSDSKCNTFLFNIETERKSRWKQRDTDTYVRANGT